MVALAVALAPVSPVAAGAAPPEPAAPAQPVAPAEPPAPAEPAVPSASDGPTDPIEIVAAPLPEPPPEPEPPPLLEPPPPVVDEPEPAVGPTPAELAKVQSTRRAGIGIMTTGGALAVVGLGMTIAFSAVNNKELGLDDPLVSTLEQTDTMSKAGGVLLVSGLAIVAAGGIVFAVARKRAEAQTQARVNVAPAIGGLVVSGRF